MRAEKDAGSTRWVETKALLLANNNGPVWKIGNEIVTGMPADSYRFPDLPENLYSRPLSSGCSKIAAQKHNASKSPTSQAT